MIAIKGATKSYFTHYSCVVIVLLNTTLCRSAFSTDSFRKLVFRLSVLSLNQDKYASSRYLILLSFYIKNSPFINNKQFIKVLQYYVKTCFQRCFVFFIQYYVKTCLQRCILFFKKTHL